MGAGVEGEGVGKVPGWAGNNQFTAAGVERFVLCFLLGVFCSGNWHLLHVIQMEMLLLGKHLQHIVYFSC